MLLYKENTMQINISKCDAMHTLNWLNAFKNLCADPKIGMAYLVNDIDGLRQRIWAECQKNFPKSSMSSTTGQISYGTKDDFWWIDSRYTK